MTATPEQLAAWRKNKLEALAEYSENIREGARRALAALERGDMTAFEDADRWLQTAGRDFARLAMKALDVPQD